MTCIRHLIVRLECKEAIAAIDEEFLLREVKGLCFQCKDLYIHIVALEKPKHHFTFEPLEEGNSDIDLDHHLADRVAS